MLPIFNFKVAVNNITQVGNSLTLISSNAFDYDVTTKWNIINLCIGIAYFCLVILFEQLKYCSFGNGVKVNNEGERNSMVDLRSSVNVDVERAIEAENIVK